VRVSYLDFRVIRLFPATTSPPTIEPEYTSHAILALKALGLMDGGGPDVFYLELHPGLPGLFDPYVMRAWLGPEWRGRFVVHYQKPCLAADMCAERNMAAWTGGFAGTAGWIEAHGRGGLEYADETALSAAMMHDNELNVTLGASQHYHRQCDERGMRSCCVVCDAAVQQLLGLLLHSPRPMRMPPARAFPAEAGGGPLRFCLRCPEALVPFTIDPTFRDVACYPFLPT
jgi:hypothetical protein